MTAPAPRARLAVAVAALVTSSIAAVQWYRTARPGDRSVLVVDNSEELTEALRRRADAPKEDPRPPRPVGPADPFARRNGLVREPVDESVARLFYPGLAVDWRSVHHPLVWFARRPDSRVGCRFTEHPRGEWVIRTNAHGFRDDGPVSAIRPDLRILVAGDSQVEGVCPTDETIPERIEHRLAVRRPSATVELLNGGIGSHSPYNYLGTLERYLELDPDLLLVFVFGGNDFRGMIPIRRYFHREPVPTGGRLRQRDLDAVADELLGLAYSEFGQLYYFLNHPSERDVAVRTLDRIARTIRDLAEDRGIRTLFVYVPAPLSGNPLGYREVRDELLATAGLTGSELAVTDELADAWLERAAAADLSVLDLRPVFARSEERLFWKDGHLDREGNERVASRVANAIEWLLREEEAGSGPGEVLGQVEDRVDACEPPDVRAAAKDEQDR